MSRNDAIMIQPGSATYQGVADILNPLGTTGKAAVTAGPGEGSLGHGVLSQSDYLSTDYTSILAKLFRFRFWILGIMIVISIAITAWVLKFRGK